MMVPDLQRPRITEINVRIDCNGCVQKIKRALNGINGIYDFYIDIPQQKLTIIGWADPERIIKAIKKVRKVATICSHTEAPDPNCQPPQPPPDGGAPPPEGGGAPAPDPGNPPPMELQNPEPLPPPTQEPPNYPPPSENPQYQNPPTESNPPPHASGTQPCMPGNKPQCEEVRVFYHHPPDYGHKSGYANGYQPCGPGYSHSGHEPLSGHPGPRFNHEPPPPQHVHQEQPHHQAHRAPSPHPVYHEPRPSQSVYVTQSYNRYRPSNPITEYHVQSPPPTPYASYARMDQYYYEDSYQNGNSSNGNVSSMFSDANPNACTIV